MGISSLGAGSSILTQDVLDQLRAADTAKFVTPKETSIKTENSKLDAYGVVDAYMDNVYESLKTLNEYGVFESRVTTVGSDTYAEVSAADSSDIQDFSLNVKTLATKEIEQSGTFASKEAVVASGTGKMKLDIGSESFTMDYDVTTTLEDMKDLINKTAGDSVTASIVQIADGDYRLFLSADNSGTGQAITITDVVGEGEKLGDALKTQMTNVQTAVDAKFDYNGLEITRTSNKVDDLLSGVTITLKDIGKTDVSIEQNRENIADKITNFVDKYNSAVFQLQTDTKSSQAASERGVFSSDSTMKGMKASLINILSTVGEGVARMQDYGLEVDADGRLSLDTTVLNTKLDEDPTSTQAFLTGGTFTDSDGFTTEVDGIFEEIETEVAKYSKYNAILDKFKSSIDTRIESLTEQKDKAVSRLDAQYAIMAKKFAAYDLIISKFNTASSMFTQMINAEIAANN